MADRPPAGLAASPLLGRPGGNTDALSLRARARGQGAPTLPATGGRAAPPATARQGGCACQRMGAGSTTHTLTERGGPRTCPPPPSPPWATRPDPDHCNTPDSAPAGRAPRRDTQGAHIPAAGGGMHPRHNRPRRKVHTAGARRGEGGRGWDVHHTCTLDALPRAAAGRVDEDSRRRGPLRRQACSAPEGKGTDVSSISRTRPQRVHRRAPHPPHPP